MRDLSQDKKQYVYRLMKAECDCGSKDFQQYLNLPTDHGVTFSSEEQPILNASDHIANENILQFGRCTSLTNPNGALGMALVQSLIPIPFSGLIAKKIAGVKCEPMTVVPWINVDEDYFIDGVPALTIESTLPCYYGGTISIYLEKETSSGENGEDDETEYDKTDQLPSEVQEKLDSFCDTDLPTPQQSGEEAESSDSIDMDELLAQLEAAGFKKEQSDSNIDFESLEMNPYLTSKKEESYVDFEALEKKKQIFESKKE